MAAKPRAWRQLVELLSGLKIPESAGVGKVLTSDAVGNATWATAAASTDVKVFSASGTWERPTGTCEVTVVVIGAGGGGGSGAHAANGVSVGGGGGGGGGSASTYTFSSAILPSEVEVVVGTGGTGGLSTTTETKAGEDGTSGTESRFGKLTDTFCVRSIGGTFGLAGKLVEPSGGAGGKLTRSIYTGLPGGAGGQETPIKGRDAAASIEASEGGGGGGGGGGGCNTTTPGGGGLGSFSSWGSQEKALGGAVGEAGANGLSGLAESGISGGGGGGGGAGFVVSAGKGGKGGSYGGGGGGGGACSKAGGATGAGGAGGAGLVVVISTAGIQGAQGIAGPKGAWTPRGEWKAATAYAVNDAVTRKGSTYGCIKAMTVGEDKEPPNATFWEVLAEAGGQTWKGEWVTGTEYAKNDQVREGKEPGSGLYVSLKNANKAHKPNETDPFSNTVLDTFKRADENPLSNGGKWEKVKMASEAQAVLRVLTERCQAEASGGIYLWNVSEYTNPQANVEVSAYPGGANTANLMICCEKPAAEKVKTGYALKIKGEGVEAEHLVEVKLFKWVAEVQSTLASTTKVEVKAGDTIRVTANAGKIQAWVKHGAGLWAVVLEAADSAYTKGFVGIGCGGTNTHLNNFAAGEFSEESNWWEIVGEPISEASKEALGLIKIAGDLAAGTGAAPQVTNLHLEADTKIKHKLTEVTDPTEAQDAATKKYVDGKMGAPAAEVEHTNATYEIEPSATLNALVVIRAVSKSLVAAEYNLISGGVTVSKIIVPNSITGSIDILATIPVKKATKLKVEKVVGELEKSFTSVTLL